MTSANFDVAFICYILLAIANSLVGGTGICQYGKRVGYFTADCSTQRLMEIPKNLKSDIEVLDLSFNFIRELANNSFACCLSIKILYLQGNSIWSIESHTFYSLTSLTVLDLNINVLTELPPNLPSSLHRLYLDANPTLFRQNVSWPQLNISSLTSLEVLTLANNKLPTFPKFDANIPNLIELNATHNNFETVSPEDLAPLCQLKFLHISPDKVFTKRNQQCDCMKFERWTSKYEIKVQSFMCKKDKTMTEKCDVEPKNTTLAIREQCLVELSARKLPYKLMAGSGIIALILCVCILFYIGRRRRQREKSKTAGGQNSRTPSVKFDNKTLEENNERGPVEEDKLLKQCTNPAFDYRGGRTRPPGSAWETPV